MTPLFHILLPTDVFPPRCGGAGWSAHALALALIARGHTVTAVVPHQGRPGITSEEVLGVPTVRFGYRAPPIPFLKNYARHELLWHPLAAAIIDRALPPSKIQNPKSKIVLHAQHVQVTPAAVIAGERLGAPVVVTVRDHWPWDYFATGLHGDQIPYERHAWASLATDLVGRLGPTRGALALTAIPYMRAHLRRRQVYLRRASAVIAVSGYIAGRLAGIVAPERLHIIPNMVDLPTVSRVIATPPESLPPGEPYLLFVGKLERNKGAQMLAEVFRALQDDRRPTTDDQVGAGSSLIDRWSLVIAGSGPLQEWLARELGALGVPVRFLDWVDHDEVLRLMAHCTLLLFPSAWGDPLSRVLLEAAACGAPILAMPTGGTGDIIIDGVSGALEPTPHQFARRLATLLADPAQRQSLADGARRLARERFNADAVVRQVETLYDSLRESFEF